MTHDNDTSFIADIGSGGSAELTIVTVQHQELVVLSVTGNIDILSAPHLSEAIDNALTGTPRGLIIDLTATEFLASAGMSALVAAHTAIAPDGQFAVVADGPSTARPMQLVGLDETLTIYSTLDHAITALS